MSYSLVLWVKIWQIFTPSRLELLKTHHCAVAKVVHMFECGTWNLNLKNYLLCTYILPVFHFSIKTRLLILNTSVENFLTQLTLLTLNWISTIIIWAKCVTTFKKCLKKSSFFAAKFKLLTTPLQRIVAGGILVCLAFVTSGVLEIFLEVLLYIIVRLVFESLT